MPPLKLFNVLIKVLRLFAVFTVVALIAFACFAYYQYFGLLEPGRIRTVVTPFFLFFLSLHIGALYVQDFYELDSYGIALRFLTASIFGFGAPRLIVAESQKQLKPDEVNLLDLIGGPGALIVQPGNVVLVESPPSILRVYGNGRYEVKKFEHIRDIVSLEEQHGELAQVAASSKDGIDVIAREIRYRYRIQRPAGGGSLVSPYPYDEEAVKKMVYNRSVTKDGINTWDKTLAFLVDTAISDYINQHTLDELISPAYRGSTPREEICNTLKSSRVRDDMALRGAELLWFDIGHFEVPEKTTAEQRLSVWQAEWMGDANRTRSVGEAQRLTQQEMGRAEGQAEMLMSIAHALEHIGVSGDSRQHMRNLVLVRTAQILEAMSAENQAGERNDLAGDAAARNPRTAR